MRAGLFLLAGGLVAALTPAAAQQPRMCDARDQVVEHLAERYGETLQSMGLHSGNGLLEVYASEETGTWTILVTSPGGTSCVVAAGEMWERDAATLRKPGEDT